MISKRKMLGGMAALGLALPFLGNSAVALEADQAKAHVEATVTELLTIVQGNGDTGAKAQALAGVMQNRAAMPQIARFAAGRAWRDMSDAQQAAYSDAFLKFLSAAYARRFQSYAGENVSLGNTSDEGKKGILVTSSVSQSSGSPITVNWLVTDRPGRVVIADIVIEGVSLLLTQRDEVTGMLQANGGNIDKLIADLKGG